MELVNFSWVPTNFTLQLVSNTRYALPSFIHFSYSGFTRCTDDYVLIVKKQGG